MKLFQRYYVFFLVLICIPKNLNSMVVDNRYFPWFSHQYNGSDHEHGCFRFDPFFITASSAWKINPGVREVDQITGFPDLQGELDYAKLAQALVAAGYQNPIPVEWLFKADIPVEMPGSFQGQGLTLSGYVPLTRHFGIGSTMLVMRLISQANLVPTSETIRILDLNAPANQAQFDQLTKTIESMVQTQTGYYSQFGVGDIDFYIRWSDVKDYVCVCRKFDTSMALGLLIPTGVQESLYAVGSVPFGGNGFWGWYLSPSLEVELKEDWKVGVVARIEKRLARTVDMRIPIINESALFAPTIGAMRVNPGTTFMISPYFALEDISEGLGAMLQYTAVVHATDMYTDERANQSQPANVVGLMANSRWLQEYMSVQVMYDLSFGKNLICKPLMTLCLDAPVSLLGARGSSRTYRITLGVTVDF